MKYVSPARFRADCARFRLLAFVTAGGITIAVLLSLAIPLARGSMALSNPRLAANLVRCLPIACYLLGLVFVGHAMGRLSSRRPIQETLASALRRIGWAIGAGGVLSVLVVTNVERVILSTRGGYLHFDVGGMTLAVIGAALILLGHVVQQAVRMQAELDQMF